MRLLRELTTGQRWGFVTWAVFALVLVAIGLSQRIQVPPAIDDLQTQRNMALGTWAMFWASIAAFCVGFASLYFLANSARLAREAAQHADRSARAAENSVDAQQAMSKRIARAYLSVTRARFQLDENGDGCTVRVRYFNSGQTPARTISASATILLAVMPVNGDASTDEIEEAVPSDTADDMPSRTEPEEWVFHFPQSVGRRIRVTSAAEVIRHIQVNGQFKYRDVFGDWDTENFQFAVVLNTDSEEAVEHNMKRAWISSVPR